MEKIQPNFNAQGLIPAIVQDAESKEVLMMAWMNAEALTLTLQSGQVHFWSRSRSELWRKGATSGNTLELMDLCIDCDEDTLLVRVKAAGPACHTGQTSCFYRSLTNDNLNLQEQAS